MSVAVVLPPLRGGYLGEFLAQQVESLHTQFGGRGAFRFFCYEADHAAYSTMSRALPGVEAMRGQAVDCKILVELYSFLTPDERSSLSISPDARTYSISWDGRCEPLRRPYDEQDLQNLNEHVFNRLAPAHDAFLYFPYGYMFRYPGMGPIDKFGYRITKSLADLASRPKNHKVVACFGGSAGWSKRCLFHQMYTEGIERRLNEHCQAAGLDLHFTVLNFGQHGNMVMNEILTYLLYCLDLKPDIVVAHDGYNDLVYGQMCDPRLLNENLAYQENLEGWSQILHNTGHLPRTQTEVPYRVVNQPVPVLKAYTKRKRQFADLAMRDGAFFIWGLQPAAFSKKRRHPAETLIIDTFANKDVKPLTANLEGLYNMLIKGLRLPAEIPFVDCHTAFARYGEGDFVMGDDVHLTSTGDAALAELYADSIIKHYLGSERWQTQRLQ